MQKKFIGIKNERPINSNSYLSTCDDMKDVDSNNILKSYKIPFDQRGIFVYFYFPDCRKH